MSPRPRTWHQQDLSKKLIKELSINGTGTTLDFPIYRNMLSFLWTYKFRYYILAIAPFHPFKNPIFMYCRNLSVFTCLTVTWFLPAKNDQHYDGKYDMLWNEDFLFQTLTTYINTIFDVLTLCFALCSLSLYIILQPNISIWYSFVYCVLFYIYVQIVHVFICSILWFTRSAMMPFRFFSCLFSFKSRNHFILIIVFAHQ